jgi:hypothetical protein
VKYLLWEQGNPMEYELDSVDGKKKFIGRLKGVYRRAVVRMRFYSEMWYADLHTVLFHRLSVKTVTQGFGIILGTPILILVIVLFRIPLTF